MEGFVINIRDLLIDRGVPAGSAGFMATAGGIAGLVFLAWGANFVAKHVILRAVNALVRRTNFKWDDVLLETGVFTRLSHLAPALVVSVLGPALLGTRPEVLGGVHAAVSLYLIFIWLAVLYAVLDALQRLSERTGRAERMPVKGFLQALKLAGTLVGVVIALGVVLGKSPVYLLSGLGALTAVLVVVFRDAILGFVAGIMISANELVRIGD